MGCTQHCAITLVPFAAFLEVGENMVEHCLCNGNLVFLALAECCLDIPRSASCRAGLCHVELRMPALR